MTKTTIKSFPTNNDILSPQVRVVYADNTSEILDLEVAISKAEEQGLTLLQITEGSDMPICKIVDSSKFLYEMKKKEKLKFKKPLAMKELKISINIGIADLKIKTKTAATFLTAGHKVRFFLRLRKRDYKIKDYEAKIVELFKESIPRLLQETIKVNIDKEMTKENKTVFSIYSASQK